MRGSGCGRDDKLAIAGMDDMYLVGGVKGSGCGRDD